MRWWGQTITGVRVMALSALTAAFGVTMLLAPVGGQPADAAAGGTGGHTGVASCAGSTCHGRLEGDGKVVRQDELMRWQEPSTPGGAHSRAFAVLGNERGSQIAATLGIGDPQQAEMCLGCHATPTSGSKGERFHTADGVGCEACHGGAQGWIASHYAVGASHAANVSRGLIPLDQPMARASVCLDCHFGGTGPGQFVTHRIMAAGHPRIAFELDLFSTLTQHWNEDADYAERKRLTDGVRMWAVGQAMAVNRSLSLYRQPGFGTEGVFPELYFYDCHSCHRRIYDQKDRVKTWEANPGRPIPAGMPPYQDENMIMLSVAARAIVPSAADRYDADVRAFHGALAKDRTSAVAAAGRLADSSLALARAIDGASMPGGMAFAVVDRIAANVTAQRFTDYAGSAQAVMALDTMLNALVRSRQVTVGAAAGIRQQINRAYAAVNDPNAYKPAAFRSAVAEAARSIQALK